MYCSVYYITQNLLIIFPFFWGVGALWDMIVSSEAGRVELKSTICALFVRIDFDSVWFCLAVIYSGVLTKKELEEEKKLLQNYEMPI